MPGAWQAVQGSSGDQMKKALVDMDDAGFFLQLQVHDEATLSVNSKEHAREAAHLMETAYGLNLPFRCDVEVGESWGEAA